MSNALTKKAGLQFNAIYIKDKGLKPYFEEHDLDVPKFRKAHVVVAGVLEQLAAIIVTESIKKVKVDRSGLRTLTRPVIRDALLINRELDRFYHMKLRNFDPNQMYSSQLPVSSKELSSYLDSKFEKLNLTPKANNLLAYVLMAAFLDICFFSNELLSFGNKKTMDNRCVKSALRLMFGDTSVYAKLSDEVTRAWNCVCDDKDEEDDGSDNEHGDDNDSDVNADSDVEDTPKKTKSSKSKKQESEDESESEGEDEDEESSDEEIVVAKPKKSKKSSKSQKKSGKSGKKTGKSKSK